jgi:uncharacterized membrane protein
LAAYARANVTSAEGTRGHTSIYRHARLTACDVVRDNGADTKTAGEEFPVTDDTTGTTATTAKDAEDANAPDVVLGLVTDGAHTLIVAQFPTRADVEAAYATLQDIERTSSLKIDSVVIAECDANGKVSLGKVTEHSTKTGLKWGAAGGVVLGVIFPPSILASAVGFGAFGAAIGKAHNVIERKGLSEELAGVMKPNTAGIVALVEDTAVVEIRKALAKADRIVEKAIDEQTAAEIDREAAQAKAALNN